MPRDPTQLSKRLSWALRHRPDALDASGWAAIGDLLEALGITRDELDAVLARPGKRRFELDGRGARIRATHGHSVEVELDHPALVPPAMLFHGTAITKVPSIRAQGLVRGRRRHVHLSEARDDAREVGARHGAPVVLEVRAAELHARGARIVRAPGSRVWLVDHVPAELIVFPELG